MANTEKEPQIVIDSFFKTWAIYVQWFTWFFGLQVATLGILAVNRLELGRVLLWFVPFG
jgi:hypothetical protein